MNLLKEFTQKNKFLLGLIILLISINTFAMLAIPFYLSELINNGILNKNNTIINTTILKMLIILIFGTLTGVLGSYFSAKFASKFAQNNRKKLTRSIESMTVNQVEKFGVASLVTRITNDNGNVQNILLIFFQMILPSPIMATISIFLTIQVSPLLAIIPLIAIIVFVLTTRSVLVKSLPQINKIQKKMDKMTLVLREFFVGVRIIRAFDNSSKEELRVNDTFNSYAQNNVKINQNFALLSPTAFALMNSTMLLIIWFGSFLITNQTLEIGSITALIEYATTTIATLIMSALVLFQLPKGIASLLRIHEVVSTESDIKDKNNLLTTEEINKNLSPISSLEYEHVHFKYLGAEKSILNDISFKINSGQTLAIVGGTGSGKSSVVKTLLRLNDITTGSITINGINIRDIPLEFLRKNISYVPQRSFLFSGTIADNFRFSNPKISQREMIRIAQVAQANDFIQSLDKEFDSEISQGGNNFSGGQKQRLSIARALAKKAGIFVFDDSFSALDYATDARLRLELKEFLANNITIIIAQRLSTITSADKIIVLDDGKIVGHGNHHSLLSNNQFYKELAQTQGLIREEP